MRWEEAGSKITGLYGKVSTLVYDNPVETDAIIILTIVGSCVWGWRRLRRLRSRAIRIIRGEMMKRKDRENYHLVMFEDAITNAAMSMVAEGYMSEAQEQEWYKFFATTYHMNGFVRTRDEASIKRAIKFRLLFFGSFSLEIPGGHPRNDLKVDAAYKPVIEIEERKSLSMSRYLK